MEIPREFIPNDKVKGRDGDIPVIVLDTTEDGYVVATDSDYRLIEAPRHILRDQRTCTLLFQRGFLPIPHPENAKDKLN